MMVYYFKRLRCPKIKGDIRLSAYRGSKVLPGPQFFSLLCVCSVLGFHRGKMTSVGQLLSFLLLFIYFLLLLFLLLLVGLVRVWNSKFTVIFSPVSWKYIMPLSPDFNIPLRSLLTSLIVSFESNLLFLSGCM